jgi:uncharacterized protein
MPTIFEVKTKLVVIQPTAFCNINCRYCYLPDRSSPKTMSLTTLARVLTAVFSFPAIASEITIVWHAGEPMVVPLHYYEQAYQLIEQLNTHGIRINTMFQTNGTLITQEWCDFIKRHKVRISVSLDGPRHIHDRERVDRTNKGTFERAMQGITLLQKNGINPAIIMVLTAYALDYPDDIWQFFKDHHLTRLSFNVEEINGTNTRSSLEVSTDGSRYKAFLRRFFELRHASEVPPFVREIDANIERIRSFTGPIFSSENTPVAMLNFDYQGNVSTFASELLTTTHPAYGNFLLGNVFKETLEEMFSHSKLMQINADVQKGVTKCRASCAYFAFCGGGSPVNKLSENGTFDSTETMQCKLRIQATMDVVLEHMEEIYGISAETA